MLSRGLFRSLLIFFKCQKFNFAFAAQRFNINKLNYYFIIVNVDRVDKIDF